MGETSAELLVLTEYETETFSQGIRLVGTACVPEGDGPWPTVLFVHGSGPLDRDENMKGQRLEVFNTMAHHFAASGIASVRYDKRGCGASGGTYLNAGHSDLVDDAVAWVDALGEQPFCDSAQIYLMGHSEGTIIAAQVTAERPTVAGLVLVCPFVEDMRSILLRQAEQIELDLASGVGMNAFLLRWMTRIVGRPTVTQRRLLARLDTTSEDVIRFGFEKIPAKWLRELLALRPPEIYRRVTRPILIVAGEKDLQCRPEDAHEMAGLAPVDVSTHVLPDLTHVLRKCEGAPSMLDYPALLKKPVDDRVLAHILEWLADRS